MNTPAVYPNFTAQALTKILQPHTDVIQRSSASGQLIFARYGGRLLGLYPRADGPNALWVNPELQETLVQGEWRTGGERLWLAPERDFFYHDPVNFSGVHVPPAIDPGHYQYTSGSFAHSVEGIVEFSSQFDLHDFQQQQTYKNSRLQRSLQSLNDPYNTGLDYVGVRIHDQVRVPDTERKFCAWSIAQVYIPHQTQPTTAFIPTLPQAKILPYFDPIPKQQAEVQAGYIRFRLDAATIYKLAVSPEHLDHNNPVKALCVMPCPAGNDWFCVVKRSKDVPQIQAHCVDPARNPATTSKGVVQSYNHGPADTETDIPHHFGEIEIQLHPASLSPDGSMVSAGRHELLAYSGSQDQILTLAQQLLQLDQPPILYPTT